MRHLLGFSAREVHEMPVYELEVYRRWVVKWLPHILYGAGASGGFDTPPPTRASSSPKVAIHDLPGIEFTGAF